MDIKKIDQDCLLKIIHILVKNYKQKLDNNTKYYDEKISIYQDIIDDKDNQINYLEREINEIIEDYHNEISKNITLEKQLNK